MSIHWPRFTELVRSHDRFLLTSHIRPDCDALGSELGMAGVLEALGKNVRDRQRAGDAAQSGDSSIPSSGSRRWASTSSRTSSKPAKC